MGSAYAWRDAVETAQMLCQRSRILLRRGVLYDDYQIESSTEGDRVKSGTSDVDTKCVMVSDKNSCLGTLFALDYFLEHISSIFFF